MNKLITFIIIVLLALCATAQPVDSIASTPEQPEMQESDFNIDFPFHRAKKSKSHPAFGMYLLKDAGFGFVGVENSGSDMRYIMSRSWNWFIMRVIGFKYTPVANGPSFYLSYGADCRRLYSNCGLGYTRGGEQWANSVGVAPLPEGSYEGNARIYTTSNMYSFLVYQPLTKRGGITAGVIFNQPISVTMRNQYRLTGAKVVEKWKTNAHSGGFWELYASVRYNDFNWYVKYSPSSLFNPTYGPKLNMISTGLVL